MELTLSQVSIRLTFVVILVVLIIVFLRKWLSSQKPSQEGAVRILPVNRKNPSVDVFAYNQTFLLLGLAISLCCVDTMMRLTTYELSQYDSSYLTIDDDVIVEDAPRTNELPPPPPPPPPPTIEEIPNEEVLEEDQPEFEDQSINENTVVKEAPPIVTKEKKAVAPPPPPPPPPPPTPEVDEIFKLVEQMPLFGGCLDKECSGRELFKYLYANLKYPPIARENGVEGKVYLQFVVEKNGTVTDIKIVRDVGAGCGLAAQKVVEGMNDLSEGWTPGKQRNVPVRVLYTLPVTFKLLN